MVECRCVFVVRNREGMMYAAMIAGHGIDRRVALHQDEASPGASRNTICPFGVVDKCLQPTTAV